MLYTGSENLNYVRPRNYKIDARFAGKWTASSSVVTDDAGCRVACLWSKPLVAKGLFVNLVNQWTRNRLKNTYTYSIHQDYSQCFKNNYVFWDFGNRLDHWFRSRKKCSHNYLSTEEISYTINVALIAVLFFQNALWNSETGSVPKISCIQWSNVLTPKILVTFFSHRHLVTFFLRSSGAHLSIHTWCIGALHPPHKIILHTFKFLLHTLCSKTHYFRPWTGFQIFSTWSVFCFLFFNRYSISNLVRWT